MSNNNGEREHSALWRALLYIQNHLDDPLSLEEISALAGYSPFHFHRLFKKFSGESPKTYIRRLRLESAAFRLKTGSEPITDIAFGSGFFTHESFTRAFAKAFGMTPSRYKDSSIPTVSGAHVNKIEKVYFQKRNCIFIRHLGCYESSGLPGDRNSLWRKLAARLSTSTKSLHDLELFGICHDDPSITPAARIRYDTAIALGQEQHQNTTLVIPAGFYLRANHVSGFRDLTDSYHYLIYHWCASYSVRIDGQRPLFEQFVLNKDDDSLQCIKIFIPIEQN